MQEFEVTANAVTIHSGVVGMSKKQASRRRHHTKPVEGEDGLYRVIHPFQFKRGEHFRYDGEPNKVLLTDLADLDAGDETPTSSRPSDTEALAAAIVGAIRGLDVNVSGNFTRGGSPQVAVLEKVLGYDITAGERDAAWKVASVPVENPPAPDRVPAIQEAIGVLDADNAEHFDEDGMPNPKAVNELLEFDVTDEEVAAAAELLAGAAD